jgi:NADH-quinone oxidoreductase subunit A
MLTPIAIAGYIALFAALGIGFLFINLLVGRLVRPQLPNKEKLEIYECGEPTIGSSFVQFDLRFYVVALLFIIFDVEVAFFFPWATVYGKATHLSDPRLPVVETIDGQVAYTDAAIGIQRELGFTKFADLSSQSAAEATAALQGAAQQMAFVSMCDILVFFAVLLVGFFYVWKRGDLDWVRAVSSQRAHAPPVEISAKTKARSIFDRETAISP